MEKIKRTLALLLVFCMMLGYFPGAVFAEDGQTTDAEYHEAASVEEEKEVPQEEQEEVPQEEQEEAPQEEQEEAPQEEQEEAPQEEQEEVPQEEQEEAPQEEQQDNAPSEAVQALLARLEALPSPEAVAEMDEAQLAELNETLSVLCDDYYGLSQEEQAQVTGFDEKVSALYSAMDACGTSTLDNGSDYLIIEGNTVTGYIAEKLPADGAIVIPDNVTAIGEAAFKDCYNLTSVTMPKVTSVGGQAFAFCSNLTSVVIPKVTDIGIHAFYSCEKLTSVSMPKVTAIGGTAFGYCEGLTAVTMPNVTTIEPLAFSNCKNLTTVTIPACTTEVGYVAFTYCTNLTSVVVTSSSTKIEDGAFEKASAASLTLPADWPMADRPDANGNWKGGRFKDVHYAGIPDYLIVDNKTVIGFVEEKLPADGILMIPESVTGIQENAFKDCAGAVSVPMPKVTNIGANAFAGCGALTSVTMPEVTDIGANAFADCVALTSAEMPKVTAIEEKAFANCTALASVTMPSVTSIGKEAFSHCENLLSVTIPDTAAYVGGLAFAGCSHMASVTVASSATKMEADAFSGASADTLNLPADWPGTDRPDLQRNWRGGRFQAVNFGGIPDYLNGEGNTVTGYVPERLPADGKIVLPETVTAIGMNAFTNCVELTSIELTNVTAIGDGAFYHCANLTSVTMPVVETIGFEAFSHCDKLPSITIPASAKSIDNLAFGECKGLTSVTVATPSANIADDAFGGVYADSLTLHTGWAVADRPSARGYWRSGRFNTVIDLGIPAYLRTDGATVFGCNIDQLPVDGKIYIPRSITTIKEGAFYSCKGLTSVDMPSVTTIQPGAFVDCSKLTTVNAPSLTAVEDRVFYRCSSLTSVTIPNVTTIGGGAFYSCSALTSVNMPSVTAIENAAFYACSSLASVELLGVTTIGDAAFDGCSSLASIEMPKVTAIGGGAFYNAGLREITISPIVKTVGFSAFGKCYGLRSVVITSASTRIENNAFDNVSADSLTLPSNWPENDRPDAEGNWRSGKFKSVNYVDSGNGSCFYEENTRLKDGTFNLYLNKEYAGEYTFEHVRGGYAIRDAEGYLTVENGKLVHTENPAAWSAKHGGLAMSTRRTTYYLASASSVSTKAVKMELRKEIVSTEHRYGKWSSNQDGTHSRKCKHCEGIQTENCTYNEKTHKCGVCGFFDPAARSVKVSVTEKVKTSHSFRRTTYTYTIKASAEGVKVSKVQYYDGSRWVKGTSFKTHTRQDALKIRITDSTGTVWSFTYQNGEVIAD